MASTDNHSFDNKKLIIEKTFVQLETRRKRNTAAAGKLMMVADSFYIPKDNPFKPYGEDAHFFHKAAQVIGVADGVGSWARSGVDAGEYARSLMGNAEYAIGDDCGPGEVNPKRLLVEAYHRVTTATRGSWTACIISLAGDKLVAVNVGDSGFMVIRGGKTIYRSPVQQQGFNCPYQLGEASKIRPEAAEELVVRVEGGDVVVAATDGLFDNLFPKEIESVVNECTDWERLPEDLARAALHKSSPMSNASSPFRVAAAAAAAAAAARKEDSTTNTASRLSLNKSAVEQLRIQKSLYEKAVEAMALKKSLYLKAVEAAAAGHKSLPTKSGALAAGVKRRSTGGEYDGNTIHGEYSVYGEYSDYDINRGKYDDITVVVAHIVQESAC